MGDSLQKGHACACASGIYHIMEVVDRSCVRGSRKYSLCPLELWVMYAFLTVTCERSIMLSKHCSDLRCRHFLKGHGQILHASIAAMQIRALSILHLRRSYDHSYCRQLVSHVLVPVTQTWVLSRDLVAQNPSQFNNDEPLAF